MLQLGAVIAAAGLFGSLLRTESQLGQDVGANPLARAVRADPSSPTDGNPAADLTLIVFTDYSCPACRAAHPAMKRAVAADRKVRVVYKDWPIFGDRSERAARVAIASDVQGIYPLVHDRLMTGRADDDRALRTSVEASGGDWERLQSDLAKNRTEISAQIERNKRQAFGLGLGGTPGYLIGPILVRGALNEGQFTRAVKQARQRSSISALERHAADAALAYRRRHSACKRSGAGLTHHACSPG